MIVTATPQRSIDRAGTSHALRRAEPHRSLSISSAPGGKGATVSRALAAAVQWGSPAVALTGLDVPAPEGLRDIDVSVDTSPSLTRRLGL